MIKSQQYMVSQHQAEKTGNIMYVLNIGINVIYFEFKALPTISGEPICSAICEMLKQQKTNTVFVPCTLWGIQWVHCYAHQCLHLHHGYQCLLLCFPLPCRRHLSLMYPTYNINLPSLRQYTTKLCIITKYTSSCRGPSYC